MISELADGSIRVDGHPFILHTGSSAESLKLADRFLLRRFADPVDVDAFNLNPQKNEGSEHF